MSPQGMVHRVTPSLAIQFFKRDTYSLPTTFSRRKTRIQGLHVPRAGLELRASLI